MKLLILAVLAAMIFFMLRQYFGGQGNAQEQLALGHDFLVSNAKEDGVKTTASGLQYKWLHKGTASITPKSSDRVTVHYHGTLIDGTVFDSSVDRGAPIAFGLNQVIKGWTEGLQLMVVGDKIRLFIPNDLAYGKRSAGKIPAGAVLIFDVELLAINE